MSNYLVADENIPYALEAFGRLGEVRRVHGRKITSAEVKAADALFVRSITRVDRDLLDGSAVRFVGTATIGYDHVDLEFLKSAGIRFASAPGSNASSVAEYITAALLVTARRQGRALDGSTIAVVGVGNVGSRVVRKCRALGMKCLLNDPPKQRESGDACYIPLAEALQEADFVTLHVPLERGGPDPTWRMVDQRFFEMLPDGAVFLNTSRGAVVCETDLKSALASGKVSLAVLDVWENEPSIDPELVDRTFLATPHIAGYSFDGKVAATAMLYEAYAAFLGQTADLTLSSLLPPPPVPFVDLSRSQGGDEDLVRQAVLSVYDIERDDEALRRAMLVETRGQEFDLVRKNYPNRREFYNTVVTVSKDRVAAARKLAGLGFTVTAA